MIHDVGYVSGEHHGDETFNNFIGNKNNYLLGDVLPYLEALQSSRLNVPTFVKNNLLVALNILVRMIPNTRCYLKIVVVVVLLHIVQRKE